LTLFPVKKYLAEMLCEISDWFGGSLFGIWMSMNVITFLFVFGTSAPVFYFYYWPSKVTYEKWINKVRKHLPNQMGYCDFLIKQCSLGSDLHTYLHTYIHSGSM
jgi:hypothetical protein